MSRRPIDRETADHCTKDDLWQIMRKLKVFTVSMLDARNLLDKSTIRTYAESLTKGMEPYLVKEDIAPDIHDDTGVYTPQYQYRLIRDSVDAPRVRKDGTEVTQGRGVEQMWRTIRMKKKFTLRDLWALSSTKEHPVSLASAETYLEYLEKAGYVRNTDGKSRPKALFLLIRDTGPKAPQIQRVKRVWDPNLKKVVWPVDEGKR